MSRGIAALVIAIAGCAAPPSYLADERGCAIAVGGSVGSRFAEPQVAGFWHEANASIAGYLVQHLQAGGYRVVPLTVPPVAGAEVGRLVPEAMAAHGCNRVLQLTTEVAEDAEGRYFAFVLALIRMVPDGRRSAAGTGTVARSEYERRYRHPRTPEAFEAFYTGSFARRAFADLEASGRLEALR